MENVVLVAVVPLVGEWGKGDGVGVFKKQPKSLINML